MQISPPLLSLHPSLQMSIRMINFDMLVKPFLLTDSNLCMTDNCWNSYMLINFILGLGAE
jgi:hypothetical protein